MIERIINSILIITSIFLSSISCTKRESTSVIFSGDPKLFNQGVTKLHGTKDFLIIGSEMGAYELGADEEYVSRLPGLEAGYVNTIADDGSYLYITTQPANVFRCGLDLKGCSKIPFPSSVTITEAAGRSGKLVLADEKAAYISADMGATFKRVYSTPLPQVIITSIYLTDKKITLGLTATDSHFGHPFGIAQSEDGGETFKLLDLSNRRPFGLGILDVLEDNGRLLLATGLLQLSKDGGKTFEEVSVGTTWANRLALTEGHVFTMAEKGLFIYERGLLSKERIDFFGGFDDEKVKLSKIWDIAIFGERMAVIDSELGVVSMPLKKILKKKKP